MCDVSRVNKQCFSHHISTRALQELVLYTIREVSTYAIGNREDFVEKIRHESKLRQEQAAKDAKKKLTKDRRRYEELDLLYQKLYESYATGKIPEDKFEMLSASYLSEQQTLKKEISEAEAEIGKYESDSANATEFLALASKYTEFTELTAPMLNEFIEKILVHAPDKSHGPREQEVEIYFKFIGKFEPPVREPTREELAAMAEKQFWRDKYWKNRDYELARRKKKQEEQRRKEAEEKAIQHARRLAALTDEIRKSPPLMPYEQSGEGKQDALHQSEGQRSSVC